MKRGIPRTFYLSSSFNSVELYQELNIIMKVQHWIYIYSIIVSPHLFNSINTASKFLPFSVNSYSTFGGISG